MSDNVIRLPRPAAARPQSGKLGLYLRPGRNQHKEISQRPEDIRVSEYLDKTVRPVSDSISAAVGLGAISHDLKKKLEKKQKHMGGYREAISHLAEVDAMPSQSSAPPSRRERENRT